MTPDWKWKEDPSPLHMLKDGESAVVGDWEIRVDRMAKFDPTLAVLAGLLSDNARAVRRRLGEESHPFAWRVERVTDGAPEAFTHMGGRAETREVAKQRAVSAVAFADEVYEAMGIDQIRWFGENDDD